MKSRFDDPSYGDMVNPFKPKRTLKDVLEDFMDRNPPPIIHRWTPQTMPELGDFYD